MTKRDGVRTRPTLVDVAREAGVGTTTVSRVINGGRGAGHSIDPKTLARVQAVMKRLDYQPSHAARALKAERTHTLGLVIPSLRDGFFAILADTIQNISREAGYVLMVLASQDEAEQETAELAVLQSHRVDGMLLVPPRVQTRGFLDALGGLAVPVVAIDRPLQGEHSFVCCDNYASAKAATEHLIAHGRKRILCLGGDPDLYTIQQRQRGYRDAVADAGLPVQAMVLAAPDEIRRALTKVLERGIGCGKGTSGIDAIFCLYNAATVAAYKLLMDKNLAVPEQISLVGFDDFPLSQTLRPAVSVVVQPVEAIGRTAVRLLLDHIQTSASGTQQLSLEASFVPRASCGCTAG